MSPQKAFSLPYGAFQPSVRAGQFCFTAGQFRKAPRHKVFTSIHFVPDAVTSGISFLIKTTGGRSKSCPPVACLPDMLTFINQLKTKTPHWLILIIHLSIIVPSVDVTENVFVVEPASVTMGRPRSCSNKSRNIHKWGIAHQKPDLMFGPKSLIFLFPEPRYSIPKNPHV